MTSTETRPARFQDTWASVNFDQLRLVAALLVLLEHARNLLFIDYPSITSHRHWMIVPYGLASAGHGAVILFFVMSGYFIGGTVLRALEKGTWSWRDYLLRRGVRLWIVLLPALLLCLLWDHLGIASGLAPGLYAGQVSNHTIPNVLHSLQPHVFFGNLFFLQGIVTPVFGSDSALWSLAYEFWYYLLFPLALVIVWPRTRMRSRLVCGVLLLLTALLVRGSILLAFPIWLAGVVLYRLPPPKALGQGARIVATVLYFGFFFTLTKFHPMTSLQSDYLLTSVTVLYLWLLLSHTRPYAASSIWVRLSREGARFSYTLYAAHLPLLAILTAYLLGDRRWIPGGRTGLYGLGLTLVVLVYSFGLAWVTEFRTDEVRRWLEKMLQFQRGSGAGTAPVGDGIAARTRTLVRK